MRLFTTVFERLPMVWVLLGLLFIAAGLYLGFEFSLAFGYIIVGLICFAYGIAIYVLRLGERPKQSAATRLSPNFISAGSTDIAPVSSHVRVEQPAQRSEQGSGTEEPA